MSEHIKVAVRVRPFLSNEVPLGCVKVSGSQVYVGSGRCFAFDSVFEGGASSDHVYVAIGQPLADSFLDGFNVSTIAYGQTGAGKTHTMAALSNDVVQEVFCRLQEAASSAEEKGAADLGYTLRVSALEVYNEHVSDLLHNKAGALRGVDGVRAVPSASSSSPLPSTAGSPTFSGNGNGNVRHRRPSVACGSSLGGANPCGSGSGGGGGPNLQLREDPKGGVYVAGLAEYEVSSEAALVSCIDSATANRRTATTLMNATSSRSHCVVTLTLERRGVVSRCCFVDLAGSERFKKSLGVGMDPSMSSPLFKDRSASANSSAPPSLGAELATFDGAHNVVADRMREGISINGGLLALGNVIVALCEKRPHVPYRSSKLTRLLQPMLGGNSRTAMVACVSPLESSIEESLNTLKYANRAKSIKTNPHLVVSAASFASPEETERIIIALRRELEEAHHQLAAALNRNHSSNGAEKGRSRTMSQAPPPPSSGGGMPRRMQRTASAGSAASRNASPSTGGGGGPRSRSRQPRKASTVSPPLLPLANGGGGGGGGGGASRSVATVDMLKQLSAAKVELSRERSQTARLAEDLFAAEYTTMIEVEKRRAAEERVLELEAAAQQQQEELGSVSTPTHSPADSPRAWLTANVSLLRQLEAERDALQALKVRREEDQVRLSAVITGGGRGDRTAAAAAVQAAAENESLVSDSTLSELSRDIESKGRQVAALERQNDEARLQLKQYQAEIATLSGDKARLEGDFARAEEQLERSEMARQHKDAERARLRAEFAKRVKAAEDKAAEYGRRVRRAQQDVKMRALNIHRIDLLRQEVEKLREETARQRATRKAEAHRGVKQSAAHAQVVTHLQRQLSEAEQQVGKLLANLARKESEIARVKAEVVVVSNGGGSARQQQQQQHADPIGDSSLAAAATNTNPRGTRNSNGSAKARGAAPPAAVTVLGQAAGIQTQIDEEVRKLEKLEKELQELQDCRDALGRTYANDDKYKAAHKGFTKRLRRIEDELAAGESRRPAPLTAEEAAALAAEGDDIRRKLQQLESLYAMFEDATQQIAEYDDRIDSLNEARKFHLHRVRRLQHARTNSGSGSSLSPTASMVAGRFAATSSASPSAGTATDIESSDAANLALPPSVREITNARARPRVITHHHRRSPNSSIDASDVSAVIGPGGGALAGGLAAQQAERTYVRHLEQTVELLKKESAGLRAQLTTTVN